MAAAQEGIIAAQEWQLQRKEEIAENLAKIDAIDKTLAAFRGDSGADAAFVAGLEAQLLALQQTEKELAAAAQGWPLHAPQGGGAAPPPTPDLNAIIQRQLLRARQGEKERLEYQRQQQANAAGVRRINVLRGAREQFDRVVTESTASTWEKRWGRLEPKERGMTDDQRAEAIQAAELIFHAIVRRAQGRNVVQD